MEGSESDQLVIERKLQSESIDNWIYLDLFNLFIYLELSPRGGGSQTEMAVPKRRPCHIKQTVCVP
jgi:hypothetical protein